VLVVEHHPAATEVRRHRPVRVCGTFTRTASAHCATHTVLAQCGAPITRTSVGGTPAAAGPPAPEDEIN
jgi:hypothetical protein